MGITIGYKGKLRDPRSMDQFCDELKDISSDMEWSYEIIDEDINKPNTSYFDEDGEIRGHIPLKGISIKVHPQCETLSFFFDSRGNIRNLVMMVIERCVRLCNGVPASKVIVR